MIWAWALVGAAIGWLSSFRTAWGLPLTAFSIVALAAAAARGVHAEAATSLAAFWIAAQGAWFLANLTSTNNGSDARS